MLFSYSDHAYDSAPHGIFVDVAALHARHANFRSAWRPAVVATSLPLHLMGRGLPGRHGEEGVVRRGL